MPDQSKGRRARAYLILGVLLEEEGELKCAAALYRQAIALKPDVAAPHLRLGFLRWYAGDAAGMYEAFSTAVGLDPRAVRQALPTRGTEPEEARLISLVLYPKQQRQPRRSAQTGVMAREISAYVAQLAQGEAELVAGRDRVAVEVLEELLREHPADSFAVPLLVLAYLLLKATGSVEVTTIGHESSLRRDQPELAQLLFAA